MSANPGSISVEGADAPTLVQGHDGAVARLTLNRPKQRNALSEALLDDLDRTLRELSGDPDVKAIVIDGAPPAFCAGHDLREMQAARQAPDGGRAAFEKLFDRCSAVMQRIVAAPQPVIAAVDGIAAAAGCQLVASCDMAVAGAGARFATNGINIGLFCSTPMVALSRNLPRKQAMELLLLGETMDAATAERFGLVNRVVPEGEALGGAMELARRVAAQHPRVVRTGKEAFYRQLEMPLAEAYAYAGRVMVENMMFDVTEAGMGAFIEKRPMPWRRESE